MTADDLRTRPASDAASRHILERAFDVLAAFRQDRPVSIAGLSRQTGLPLTTVNRIVRQLTAIGVTEQHSAGGYSIGLRLWELGMTASAVGDLRSSALPFLEDLHELTGQHVQLSVISRDEVVVVERLSDHGAVPLIGYAGGRLPRCAASGGLAQLAFSPPEVIDRAIGLPRVAYTATTPRTDDALRQFLADTRRLGVAVCREFIRPGSLAIAAPILVRRTPVAAVSIIVAATEAPSSFIPVLQMTSRSIARKLGRETT